MIPVAFQGLEFPDQRQLDWTEYESLQWMRANQQYFHPDNGVYYDTGSITKVADLPSGGVRTSTLAANGKIYAGGLLTPHAFIFDPTDNTIVSQSTGGANLEAFASFYSPFTEKVYFSGGPNGARNISVIDTNTDSLSYNVAGPIAESAYYPVSPVLDGRYAYGSTRPDENIIQLDLLTETLNTISVGAYTGDHNNGALAWNDTQWHSIGGGGSGLLIIDVTDGSVIEGNWNDGISLGPDSIRHLVQHPDGYLYSISFNSPYNIYRIDPVSKDIQIIGSAGQRYNIVAYELGFDGRIYMSTQDSRLAVLDPRNGNFFTPFIGTNKGEAVSPSLDGDLFIFTFFNASNPGVYKIPLVGKEKIKGVLQTGNHIAGRFRANY